MQCRERQGGLREAAAAAATEGAEVDRSVQLSCGEHADYGLLTFVNQEDHVAALQASACFFHPSWAWLIALRSRCPIPCYVSHSSAAQTL